MNGVRIGIAGVGNMGFAHADSIFSGKILYLRLCALCDSSDERRAFLKERFPGVSVFATHTEMLQSGLCEAILIATPHKYHPEIAVDAFARGIHVLTEKPAGVSVSGVRAMNEAAKKSGLVFAIMFNQRTNPLFRKAREIVTNGELGEPKRLVWIITNWYRTQSYYDSGSWRATWGGEGGGVLINQAPHNLDIWQWIFGMPQKIKAFCARGKYHNIDVEDDATIYAEYENGAVATFITSTGEYPGSNRLEISGDLGKIVLEDGKLRHWKLKEHERNFCFTSKESFFKPESEYNELISTSHDTAHKGILQNFANAIIFGEPLIAPGDDGINSLSISNAAYLSSFTDRTVSLPFEEAAFDKMLVELASNEDKHESKNHSHHANGYQKRWSVRW